MRVEVITPTSVVHAGGLGLLSSRGFIHFRIRVDIPPSFTTLARAHAVTSCFVNLAYRHWGVVYQLEVRCRILAGGVYDRSLGWRARVVLVIN